MPDQATKPTTSTPVNTSQNDVPLSDHAEDVLADAVGHEIELVNDDNGVPLKTVREVLADMVGDRDELSITLEYGTGESGVDQASWEIEVTSLQRAYMRKQKHDEVDKLSKQIFDEVRVVQGCVEHEWVEFTSEFRRLMKLFEQSVVNRQEIDDFQHQIFGRGRYIEYLDYVISGSDTRKLLNAVSNLRQVSLQLETDYNALIDPNKVDNEALADAIIATDGDIDKLSIELERDYSSAVFRRNISTAMQLLDVINQDNLKQYKLWAHSFNLNLREVLATEHSATNGKITDKSRDLLKEMLLSGADQLNSIIRVLQ